MAPRLGAEWLIHSYSGGEEEEEEEGEGGEGEGGGGEGEGGEEVTRKLDPKFVSVARAVAGPLTAKGKTSPTISQLMGPKLTCERRQI